MIKTGSECPLIRDICEIYREKRVSTQTKAYVKAHLAVCNQCRGVLPGAGEQCKSRCRAVKVCQDRKKNTEPQNFAAPVGNGIGSRKFYCGIPDISGGFHFR